jgi:hypothetical protein
LDVAREVVRGRQTLFVNAAIDPDEDLKPRNPPWLVELNLSTEKE